MALSTRLFLLFISTFLITTANAQQVLSGRLLDAQSQAPIPFANIGIPGTETGTLSNSDGSFSLQIPEKYRNRTVLFSALGYQPAVREASLGGQQDVLLQARPLMLEQVTITASRAKRRIEHWGNGKSLLLSGQLYCDTLSAGSAMALLIDKQAEPELTFVESVSLYIARNKFPEFRIRLRFMAVDSAANLKPGADLVQEQIIAVSAMRKGWLEFPVPPALRVQEQAFYIVCEWILDKEDRKQVAEAYAAYMQEFPDRVTYDTVIVDGEKLSIPKVSTIVAGTVFGTTQSKGDLAEERCYYRNNSFGEWKRSSGILSARITLSNQAREDRESTAPATAATPCEPDDTHCKSSRWAGQFREDYSLPGLQLAIWKDGKLLCNQGHGLADKAAQKPVSATTQFRIASVSKTMTAAVLLRLLDKKGISPDTPVQEIVPEFPNKEYPITLRQLAAHLGGIRHYHGKSREEIFVQEHYENSTAALARFKNDPLVTVPGAEFYYSSFGYILLGAVIEKLSGSKYLDYMQQILWQPQSMAYTYGDIADSLMQHKAHFYLNDGKESPDYNLSYSYPTGGLLSTAEDLVRFGAVVAFDPDFLSPALRSEMFEEQRTSGGKKTGYGLGWYVTDDPEMGRVWFHTGELPSSGSVLLILPDKKLVLALLSNGPIIDTGNTSFLREVIDLCRQLLAAQ